MRLLTLLSDRNVFNMSYFRYFSCLAGVFVHLFAINYVVAEEIPVTKQSTASNSASTSQANSYRSLNDWLVRIHDASRRRAYTGTFVVSVGDAMSSARIWHVCDGDQQMERVESLTGAPRSTFRHNNHVVTFFPEAKIARSEQREALSIFPNFLKSNDSAIAEFYTLKVLESERVAGLEADVVQLIAKDALRYSYRIWTERKSGLVVKLQTVDASGRVIEQAAFSELTLDAPVKMEKLIAMMNNTAGHKLEQVEMSKTTAIAQGWAMPRSVPGFTSVSCFKRPAQLEASGTAGNGTIAKQEAGRSAELPGTMQWIFSDGLATVSLFVEPFDRKRHSQEGVWSMGATQTLAKRMDDWWLTAVGEVPPQTLKVFAQQLERKK
jgi:sigma-E factor negative regulatory protein RseB